MHTVSKIFSWCISASFALHLLPSVKCSSHQQKLAASRHISIKKHEDSRMTLDIAIHGILLWASMGFLMPIGILVIRMSSTHEFHRTRLKVLFYLHAILQHFNNGKGMKVKQFTWDTATTQMSPQFGGSRKIISQFHHANFELYAGQTEKKKVCSVLLATAGAVISIRNFENLFDNCHQRLGLALYAAIYLQVLIGFRRPRRESKPRRVWYLFHWLMGTATSFVGIFNTYTGLKAYHIKTSKNTSLWTVLFTAQVSFMAFFYLFQDKWLYIQKQGVMLGNEPPSTVQIVSQGGNENKEAATTEPHRKSNALGAYFSRSNALKKLFQLT